MIHNIHVSGIRSQSCVNIKQDLQFIAKFCLNLFKRKDIVFT